MPHAQLAGTRVTATAMATGEAAGLAAALAIAAGKGPGDIKGTQVRESLAKHNAGPFTDG
jgi:hypothetical protein